MRDLPNLDFLRACAVLSVVAEHTLLACGIQQIWYWQVRWIGVMGVFLFFIHTSLVLLWSLERKPYALEFYLRRAFRIYPLAITAILLTLAFHAPVAGVPASYFHYQAPRTVSGLVGSLLLIPNLLGGYQPMGVLWSLPYEVEMYLCLPPLYFFLQRNMNLVPLLLFWAFEIAVCRPLFHGESHNFFLAIPYFLPGAMAYVGFSRWRARLPAWLFPPALLALWALFLLRPGWRAADAVCLAAGLGLPLFQQLRSRVVQRISHEIATYSYGIYLTHPFALVLGFYLAPHRPLLFQLIVALGCIALFSTAAYHLVELPMMRVGSRIAQRAEHRHQRQQLANTRIAEAEIQ